MSQPHPDNDKDRHHSPARTKLVSHGSEEDRSSGPFLKGSEELAPFFNRRNITTYFRMKSAAKRTQQAMETMPRVAKAPATHATWTSSRPKRMRRLSFMGELAKGRIDPTAP